MAKESYKGLKPITESRAIKVEEVGTHVDVSGRKALVPMKALKIRKLRLKHGNTVAKR